MILSYKVIVAITPSREPSHLPEALGRCKQACVNCLAANWMLTVASNVEIISQAHELLDRVVHEDHVSLVEFVGVVLLLVCEPIDSLVADASTAGKPILVTVRPRLRVHQEKAEKLSVGSWIYDRDSGGKMADIRLVS